MNLSADHLRLVLAHFGHGPEQNPGHFTTSLLEAFTHADTGNLQRLVIAFPTIGEPFRLVRSHPLGVKTVQLALAVLDAGMEVRIRDILPAAEGSKRGPGWVLDDVAREIPMDEVVERERRIQHEVMIHKVPADFVRQHADKI